MGKVETMPMTPFRALATLELADNANASENELRKAWQYIYDSGMTATLPGWYGRQCRDLLEAGMIDA